MTNQELVLREKLAVCYSDIFEEKLIDEIVKVGRYDKIKSGELLIDIGSELTHIPLILDGVVKIIRKEKEGEEILLYFLERGDTCAISFVNCINKKKSIFKGVVQNDIEAIFIPVENIDSWLANFKSWRHFIIDSYHFRLIEMVESIDCLAFMQMSERLLKYLTDKVKINNDVDLEITHQEIAQDLNSSRVVITRVIKQLHDEGKIFSTRNKIKVLEFHE
ncbi:Crp/Fnr family transcriptional regulator [Winogradskyella alexanderae]|uniref:Crp/Fnr family transcriptional regulator n=1 Tax=Winogradskyella alexanderae TaxID=2877123 RepID=A0ABS7XT08_9FLAO|nr:Crp/Fnr family transcriptional regulator [Winogradskyella alexanderae]MCA0133153.1 Crp/Fnr family transcriptional regulator [Winogradskyella alexanderae]